MLYSSKSIFLGISLFFVTWSFFALTYRGMPIVIDEEQIFDSAEGFVRRGEASMNYDFHQIGITSRDVPFENICNFVGGTPWQSSKYEFMVYVFLAPLLALSFTFEDIGTWHLLLFFNLFITALTAVSIYVLAMRRGASHKVGWLAGLLFAVGTIAWFYSVQLYREPLAALFMVWAFGLASLWRDYWADGKHSWRWVTLVSLFTLLFVSVKIITSVLIPGLLLLILPIFITMLRKQSKKKLFITSGLMVGASVLLILGLEYEVFGYGDYYDFSELIGQLKNPLNDGYSLEGFLGYQIGPSRSFWLYSPVLLLGLYGAYLLWRRGEYSVVLSMAFCLLGFSYLYGWLRQSDWIGSWGWGPRYLAPLIPLVVLFWVVPALEKLLESTGGIALIAVTTVAGMLVQLVGMAVPMSNYYTDVFRAGAYYDYAQPELYDRHWMGANWTWEWMQIRYNLANLDFNHLDFAWPNAQAPLIPLALIVGLVGLGMLVTVRLLGRNNVDRRAGLGMSAMGALLLVAIMGTTVYSLREDPRYINEGPEIYPLIKALNHEVQDDELVFVDRAQYKLLFMNYFKPGVPVVTLPYAPAEFGIEATLADPIDKQIGQGTVCGINWTADHYDQFWLVSSVGPYDQAYLRPAERYLATQYFPVREISPSAHARAIEFLGVDAPTHNQPAMALDFSFGDQLQLKGIDLPLGTDYRAGDGIPVSLMWQVLNAPTSDYTIGLYVMNAAGQVVAQRDSQPQGTFASMLTWQVNETYRDNHGLILPKNLPSGDYTLIISLYRWQDGAALVEVGSGATLVQLASLHVAAP